MSSKKDSMPNNFNKRFAYVIEILKKNEGISQRAIAETIGISAAALSDLMTGKSKSASGKTLSALQAEFGVSPVWLTKQEGEPLITHENSPKLSPFLPDEMAEIRHMKEMISEKNERIRILTDQVEGLKADKERLTQELEYIKKGNTSGNKEKNLA